MTTTPTAWVITRGDGTWPAYWSDAHLWQQFDPGLVRTFGSKQEAKTVYRVETGKAFPRAFAVVQLTDEQAAAMSGSEDTTGSALAPQEATQDDALGAVETAETSVTTESVIERIDGLAADDETEVLEAEWDDDEDEVTVEVVSTGGVPTDDDIDGADEVELAMIIEQCQTAISGFERQALPYAIAAGKALLAAKESVGHKHWLPWLQANTSVTARMSQIYIQLANAKCVSHLEIESSPSINDALKIIREHKKVGTAGDAKGRPLGRRGAAIAKSAEKLAAAITQLAADLEDAVTDLDYWEAYMNENVAAPLTEALEALDRVWGVA